MQLKMIKMNSKKVSDLSKPAPKSERTAWKTLQPLIAQITKT